jgi:hypothetical protein
MRPQKQKRIRRRRNSFIRAKPVRPLGSPLLAALLGPGIFLGIFGVIALGTAHHPKATLFADIFNYCIVASPFVALFCAICAGCANFIGTRKHLRKALPLVVAAFGFIAGAVTAEVWNRVAVLFLPEEFAGLHANVVDLEIACWAGVAGAVVFVLLGMIVWRFRRPRTLLET